MKRSVFVLLALAAFCCGTAVAQEKSQPLVQLRIQSFEALTANAQRVASALGLGADFNPGDQLPAAIETPTSRAWTANEPGSWRLPSEALACSR